MSCNRTFLFIVVTLAIIKTGTALRCWSCSSDLDTPCADYFNVTSFTRYFNPNSRTSIPQMLECGGDNTGFGHIGLQTQRPVCMKKIQTTYGRTTYIRQCRFVHPHETVGTCPSEVTSSATTIDFCEYCDRDGCNSASNLSKTILSIVLPVFFSILFLAK